LAAADNLEASGVVAEADHFGREPAEQVGVQLPRRRFGATYPVVGVVRQNVPWSNSCEPGKVNHGSNLKLEIEDVAKSKEAPKKETGLTVVQQGELALASGYGEYADDGFQNVTAEDLQIPFLTVMQSNSPEIKPTAKGGLGMTIGQLMNTVTQDVYDGETGVGLVPAMTLHEWVEWAPRDSGGGFIGRYDCDDKVILEAKATQKFGQYTRGENNLVETYYIYGILYDVETGDSLGPVVISFSKTKIKRYRRLITSLRQFQLRVSGENGEIRKITPPLYAHSLVVHSCDDQNAKGEFQNFNIVPAKENLRASLIQADSALFQEAYTLKKSIEKGEAKAAYSSAAGAADDEEGGIPRDENGEPAF
jgi:hypothetical protein